jgi:pimeloyl-ACP methyl ester carboxylesterase
VGADYLALVDHLGGQAALIGNSFTPSAVVWAAVEAPEKIAGIVLISLFTQNPQLNPLLRLVSGLMLRSPALWRTYYKSLYPTAKPDDFPEYSAKLVANLREPGRMAACRAMMAADKQVANRRLPDVRCPALVVYGTKDPDFPDPAAESREARQLLASAEVTVDLIDGAGHYPHVEMPEVVAPAVLELLAKAFRA